MMVTTIIIENKNHDIDSSFLIKGRISDNDDELIKQKIKDYPDDGFSPFKFTRWLKKLINTLGYKTIPTSIKTYQW